MKPTAVQIYSQRLNNVALAYASWIMDLRSPKCDGHESADATAQRSLMLLTGDRDNLGAAVHQEKIDPCWRAIFDQVMIVLMTFV